ncbi:uncharacterized protein DUF3603 [Salsuginibacillus halophilus]|uniref:Uncharacterized protein DUF3603 n=1 Tax=Salsuginibacillus halophilus TaxID=517424 RepID=A0A2P8HXG8_9BACI|nr:DUF3603 family protein [Salsuginibacillus halophilus]PSL50926.1 uncharacterized protein DUF3603 [Salsuginibacillus halophilus]
MVRIRDVWVNWFEGEENSYNVCPYHEWRSEDQIEVLDSCIIVRVTKALFEHLENTLEPLPPSLLKAVYQQTKLRKNMRQTTLDYCFAASDGERGLVIDTIGYDTAMRKSRMTPRQEALLIERIQEEGVPYFSLHIEPVKKGYHILSPPPHEMLGLTRRERQLKQLLYMALDELYTTASAPELRYWYTEWNPEAYPAVQQMDKHNLWHRLYREIKQGWSSAHHELCRRIIRGQPFFEKLWELQHQVDGSAKKSNL